uniref:Uncharacterized protein n=1 Tax=Manihot esculenta TaxID=3983 RepID=A0A2C9V9Z2_MANES
MQANHFRTSNYILALLLPINRFTHCFLELLSWLL